MATSVPPVTNPATAPASSTPPAAAGDQVNLMSADELAKKVARLIVKNQGDPTEAIGVVMEENAKYRERHRQDTDMIARLRDKEPKDGQVLVSKDDSELLNEIKEFKTVFTKGKVKEFVEEHDALKAGKTQRDTDEANKKFAAAVGYDPEMLPEIVRYKDWHIEGKTITVPDPDDKTGKKFVERQVPHVRPKGNPTAPLEPLTVAAERDLSKPMFDALRKAPAKDTSSGRSSTADGGRPMAAFPSQTPAGTAKAPQSGLEVAQSYVARQYTDPTATPDKKE